MGNNPQYTRNNHGFFHCSYRKHVQNHAQQSCISFTWARNSDTKPPFWQLTTSGHYSLGKKTRLYRSTETWSTSFSGAETTSEFCNQETRLLARCVSVPSPAGVDMLETTTFGVEFYGQKLFARHLFALAVAHVIHLQKWHRKNLP